ncbi:5-methyltetrahydropteroyltriglutamate--homocysteine methyltransferase [Jeotgalicoccus saudimassiliensis]|uniref:5-methyltetrahydropteroyltriglutamate--homocysteine methyltransferase n=1 Tax=Jeotgalicoccus saudimassiliensis TaxID=1461582 RepID=A0A078LV14_9STAP|nr:5-methyltetrahydropteroyltriglutamate--homocysteine S-methyltransferase [Jeotgalicoccus saudimassiliensis]CDZ99033.1 5-methyltetrahydropteroyltriglutamate--homocysteine methyltransferase [Jeotgalicoccus saudimassiliensis]
MSVTAVKTAPFKFDNVGSFLRPADLKQAREDFKAGSITQEELTSVENEAIKNLVQKQKDIGLKAITDGEFRRSWWHLDFFWGLNGVEKSDVENGYNFVAIETRAETARLTGKISGENHPFIDHFKYINQFADGDIIARQTIPAPAQFLRELTRPEIKAATEAIYPDEAELVKDIAAAYRTFIQELHEAGCTNLQLDDCTWGMIVDENFWKNRTDGLTIDILAEQYVELNNSAIEEKPEGLTITTHVCRGNYRSTWASSGAYDKISDELFGRENVAGYYLEFDTERAGGFESLEKVSGDKKVVLGLVSSKVPELESKAEIISRIEEAAKYIDKDRLCLSPQCGFASTEEGNNLTEEEQWAKLQLVKEISEEVWGS